MARSRKLVVQLVGDARSLTRALDSVENKLKKGESGWMAAGRVATMAFAAAGVGVAAAVGVSVKAFADFEAALNESWAIMGDVSQEQKDKMADAARAIAKETTFSAEQAASAFYYLASAGLTADQAISALPITAKFAQAGLFDLETATDLLVNSQIAMGLESENAAENLANMTRVADVLTEANNFATGSVQEFAEALTNKAAGALRAMNKDLEEGVAVLMAFADRGVKGQIAGEKLSILLRDTARAAARNSEEFAQFGVEIFDSSGKMKNLADVVGEFEDALGPMSDEQRATALETMGMTRSVGDIIRTLMGASGEIREYETQLRSAGGTTEEVADKQMQTFNAQMTLLKNNLMDIAIEIGSKIVPKLMPLVKWVSENLPVAFAIMRDVWVSDVEPVLRSILDFGEKYVLPILKEIGKWMLEHGTAVKVMVAIAIGALAGLSLMWISVKLAAVGSMAIQGADMIIHGLRYVKLGVQAAISGAKQVAAWVVSTAKALWAAAVQAAQMALLIGYWIRLKIQAALSAARVAAAWVMQQIAAAKSLAIQGALITAAILQWIKLGLTAVAQAARVAAAWVVQQVKALASIGLQIAQMVLLGAQYVWLGLVALASAAQMALAWLIALGPIALIVAAVIALAVIIIMNFDTIKKWVTDAWNWIWERGKAVFNWIRDNWPLLLAIITGPIGIAVLIVSRYWNTIWEHAAAIMNFIAGRVWWLRDAITGAFSWVYTVVSMIWDWIWDKIDTVAGWIGDRIDQVTGWVDDAIDAVNSIPGAGVIGGAVSFLTGGQTGGVATASGIAYLARGGLSPARGRDTVPAMLSPGEMVLTARQQKNLFDIATTGRGGGGGGIYIDLSGAVISTETQFQDMVVRALRAAGSKGMPVTLQGRQL